MVEFRFSQTVSKDIWETMGLGNLIRARKALKIGICLFDCFYPGLRDSTEGKALALHTTYPSFIPGTTFCSFKHF